MFYAFQWVLCQLEFSSQGLGFLLIEICGVGGFRVQDTCSKKAALHVVGGQVTSGF